MCRKLTLVLLILLVNILSSQTIEKQQVDSLRKTAVENFRKLYWNTFPKLPKGWVNDYEKVFSDDEERKLDSVIRQYEKETSIEIVIVTIDTTKTSRENFEALSLRIAKTWEIGKKGKDNGILIAFSKGYNMIRIQNGNGIEKILSNQETGKIIQDNFIPEFKKGNYYKGMFNGIGELMEDLKVKLKI